ncbi:hypothetical protein D3C86_401650 [compost metagenome]
MGDLREGLARDVVEAVGIALDEGNLDVLARLFNEEIGDQRIALAFLDLLPSGMQVAGIDRRDRHASLLFLAQALGGELVVPEAEELESLAPCGHQGKVVSLLGCQELERRVEVGRVLMQIRRAAALGHVASARHQFTDVDAGHGGGQKPHRGEHGVATAHVIRNDEGFEAFPVGQVAELALGSVGGGDDVGRVLGAVDLPRPLMEDAEADGGLQGGAGLRDDVEGVSPLDAGGTRRGQEAQEGGHRVGIDVIAFPVDLGATVSGVARQFVTIRVGQGLDQGPCSQVRAADAHHHMGVAKGSEAVCRGLDGRKHVFALERQVEEAEEVGSTSRPLGDLAVNLVDFTLKAEDFLRVQAMGVADNRLEHGVEIQPDGHFGLPLRVAG